MRCTPATALWCLPQAWCPCRWSRALAAGDGPWRVRHLVAVRRGRAQCRCTAVVARRRARGGSTAAAHQERGRRHCMAAVAHQRAQGGSTAAALRERGRCRCTAAVAHRRARGGSTAAALRERGRCRCTAAVARQRAQGGNTAAAPLPERGRRRCMAEPLQQAGRAPLARGQQRERKAVAWWTRANSTSLASTTAPTGRRSTSATSPSGCRARSRSRPCLLQAAEQLCVASSAAACHNHAGHTLHQFDRSAYNYWTYYIRCSARLFQVSAAAAVSCQSQQQFGGRM